MPPGKGADPKGKKKSAVTATHKRQLDDSVTDSEEEDGPSPSARVETPLKVAGKGKGKGKGHLAGKGRGSSSPEASSSQSSTSAAVTLTSPSNYGFPEMYKRTIRELDTRDNDSERSSGCAGRVILSVPKALSSRGDPAAAMRYLKVASTVLNDDETQQAHTTFDTASGWFISEYVEHYERESNMGKMLHPLAEEFSVLKSQLVVQAVTIIIIIIIYFFWTSQ